MINLKEYIYHDYFLWNSRSKDCLPGIKLSKQMISWNALFIN